VAFKFKIWDFGTFEAPTEARFEASLFRGRWMIYRKSDEVVCVKFTTGYTALDIKDWLIHLNQGDFGLDYNYHIPTKVSRNKKQRIETIKAIVESFKWGKMDAKKVNNSLHFWELTGKDKEERIAKLAEMNANDLKKAKENPDAPKKKRDRFRNRIRGGPVMKTKHFSTRYSPK
jgi:hypothetical protein